MGNIPRKSQTALEPIILNEEMTSMNHVREGSSEEQPIVSTFELLKTMDAIMLQLKGKFISEDGRYVDYKAMATSETFQTYVSLARKLIGINLDLLSEFELKVLFLNLYNLLTLHALAERSQQGTLASPANIPGFWKIIKYNVGGLIFSLDDIEHGILRANRPHPSRKLLSRFHFSSSDPRSKYSLKVCDPRLHFVLNCGSQSCPRVNFLNDQGSEQKLDRSLTAAARSFCQSNVILKQDSKEIWLSKIFDWYKDDFGHDDQSRMALISSWLSEEDGKILEVFMQNKFKIKFFPYDWSLNNKDGEPINAE